MFEIKNKKKCILFFPDKSGIILDNYRFVWINSKIFDIVFSFNLILRKMINNLFR